MTLAQTPSMKVDILGYVRATPVPTSHAFLPVFEAVVNAIHSTEDRFGDEVDAKGKVEVVIHRVPQGDLLAGAGRPAVQGITSIEVIDNGLGFNAANLTSFETAYSTAKAARGGKGVGRFSWLVVFKEAAIDSIYDESSHRWHRKFAFRQSRTGIEQHTNDETRGAGDLRTVVHLHSVQDKYVDALRRGIDVIAERLFEHCFPYFVLGRCPTVVIHDVGADGTESLTVNERRNELALFHPVDVTIGHHVLRLQHVQQAYKGDRKHEAHLCANKRQVQAFPLAQVSELGNEPIRDDQGQAVVHHVFVSGSVLDESVDSARTRLVIPDDDPLFAATGALDMKSLKAAIGAHVNEHLAPVLQAERAENLRMIERHIRTEQPEYRHLLNKRPEDLGKIRYTDNPRQLDESLYRVQQTHEAEVRRKQADVEQRLEKEGADPDVLADELQKVIAEINEAGQANLVRYVAKRRAVLKFVRTLLGKNALEAHIHKVIFPMRKNADEVEYDDHNLWLVDDMISFYEFVASDQSFTRMDPVPVESLRRPDLLAFKTGDPPFQHIALLELKRPERADDNPVEQLVDYAVKLREGGAKDVHDRTLPGIPKSVRIDAFALATLTPELEKKLRTGPGNMEKVDGDWRWVGGMPAENLTIEVLDFQAFVSRAEKRNRAFFTKLGLQ